MCNKSRNWFFLLAAGFAASMSLGTIAAAAPISIGMKVPLVRSDVLQAGYQHNYGDYTVDGSYYWPRAYDAPPRSYYEPSYYDSSYYDRSDYRVWSPPRRRTCGEYYYWNGVCCVDARRHPPYVGPKW
jgi:hypothetical protein